MPFFVFQKPSEIWSRLSSIDLKAWQPRDPWPLIQCLVAIGATFLIRIEGEHMKDYSNVSGFFGPGAFWAWVITCVSAILPTAGPALLRLVWSNPLPGADCEISDIPAVPGREISLNAHLDSDRPEALNNDQDKIHDEKLSVVRRLLLHLFCLQNFKESHIGIKIFLKNLLNTHAGGVRLFASANDDLELLGERAEMVLNMMPSISTKESLHHAGFIEYDLPTERELDQGMERISPLALASKLFVEDLSMEFPWLQMDHKEFILHLLELRNRVKFLIYRDKPDVMPSHLDPNTCTAALYPLVACVSPVLRHLFSSGEPWSAGDEAAARVAQVSLGFACIAIISDLSQSRPSLRLGTWVFVMALSQMVHGLRIHYIETEKTAATIMMFFYGASYFGIIGLPVWPYLVAEGYARLTELFPRLFNRKTRPAEPKVNMAAILWAITLSLPVSISYNGTIEKRRHLREGNIWSVYFGFPIPRSPAAISDLDQASALGVAIFLLVLNPFQKILIYLVKTSLMWLGFKIVLPIGDAVQYYGRKFMVLLMVLKELILNRRFVQPGGIVERLNNAGRSADTEENNV